MIFSCVFTDDSIGVYRFEKCQYGSVSRRSIAFGSNRNLLSGIFPGERKK